jgi:hypothetical protein
MLTDQNIEAELSYAYLHAVASRAGFSCEYTIRHMDHAAVDAIVREDGRFLADDSELASFELCIQLKATYQRLHEAKGRWSYPLPLTQYNKLRSVHVAAPWLLVVLLLPEDANEWLRFSIGSAPRFSIGVYSWANPGSRRISRHFWVVLVVHPFTVWLGLALAWPHTVYLLGHAA